MFFLIAALALLLYQNQGFLYEKLKDISFNTDKKNVFVYKKIYAQLPPKTNNINYILKIETQTDTNSTVTDSDKHSGYEVITTSDVFLYKEEEYDKLIYSFQEKKTMFELSPNQVLSTLASKIKHLKYLQKISQKVF